MTDLLWRSFGGADLQLRADGRVAYGLMCPFGQPATVAEFDAKTRSVVRYTETFQQGAFSRSINSGRRIPGYAEHGHRQGRLPIGTVRNLEEQSVGLLGEIHFSKTRDGDEAMELTRDGAFGAFSVGFGEIPDKDRWADDRSAVVRTEVKLGEVSVTAQPVYAGAEVMGFRNIAPWMPGFPQDLTLDTPGMDSLGLEEEEPEGLTVHPAYALRARLLQIQGVHRE